MRTLNVKLNLSEETKVRNVWMVLDGNFVAVAEHITDDGMFVITDRNDYEKICHCGEKVELVNEYMGACRCIRC